jgi:hypothetical protein
MIVFVDLNAHATIQVQILLRDAPALFQGCGNLLVDIDGDAAIGECMGGFRFLP